MEAERTADREAKYSRFHTCRGSNIALSNDGRTAWRKKGEVRKALVFTEGPIPVGNAFQLKILSDQSMGDLRIGITSCDPSTSQPLPPDASQVYHSPHYWVLSGEVMHHRAYEKRMNFSTADLLLGDIVGCCVTKKGRLEYFVNGKNKGIGWGGLPTDKPLWGLADLSGKTDHVESQFFCAEPMVAQSLLQNSEAMVSDDSTTRDRSLQNGAHSLPSSRQHANSLDPALSEVRRRSQTDAASKKMAAVQGTSKSGGSCPEELKAIRMQLQDILGPSAIHMRGVRGDGVTVEGEEGGADIFSLLSALKVRMSAEREEMQLMQKEHDTELDKRDKRIRELESDVVIYQVAAAKMEQEHQSLKSKYLSLIQELQKHVSHFQDSARETQRELEAVRAEFAVMKREVEARPAEKGYKDKSMDGLTGKRGSADVHSVPLVGEQQSKLVLDTKPVKNSEEPG